MRRETAKAERKATRAAARRRRKTDSITRRKERKAAKGGEGLGPVAGPRAVAGPARLSGTTGHREAVSFPVDSGAGETMCTEEVFGRVAIPKECAVTVADVTDGCRKV